MHYVDVYMINPVCHFEKSLSLKALTTFILCFREKNKHGVFRYFFHNCTHYYLWLVCIYGTRLQFKECTIYIHTTRSQQQNLGYICHYTVFKIIYSALDFLEIKRRINHRNSAVRELPLNKSTRIQPNSDKLNFYHSQLVLIPLSSQSFSHKILHLFLT